uniref:uncharacterized protein LOC124063914 n=1 Tax=Scatophagus argus TaxID=75038 RepID=UPI001ED84175|nr:uncharacterized protein LOC124063914 [Scatophagus argus]
MGGDFKVNCLCNLLSASVFIAGCTFVILAAFPIAQISLGVVYIHECPAAPFIPVYVMVCGILALLLMGMFALPNLLCPTKPNNIFWTLSLFGLILFVFVWFFYGSYEIYSIYPPNYDKSSFNNSIYIPTAPDNKTNLILENQNKSLPSLNQTWTINNNQTLRNLTQTLASSNISSQTNREHLNAPQMSRVMAVAPYCNRSLYLFAFWTTTLVYVFAGHALVIIICISGCMKITDKLGAYFST